MDPLSLAERLLRHVWGVHFRIPELAYWALLGLGVWLLVVTIEGLAGAALLVVGLVGIARWNWHRWKCRGGLVVALFSTSPGQRGREEEVQRVILASLRDKIPPEAAGRVHGVPVAVGSDDRDFALRLRRRLRADFLLHGRIADASDGGWSVYARVMQPAARSLIHRDPHTRDVTPARVRWGPIIDRLTPAIGVLDEEYPFDFAFELEAIVKGTAGQLAVSFEDHARGERWLRDAIGISPASTSHQIDKLRVDLARALAGQGRPDEALELLRKRAESESPSPELLRTVHSLLDAMFPYGGAPREVDEEALAALRRAAEYEADPQRPMTLYNLLMMVFEPGEDDEEEAAELLEELLGSHSYYRHAWYVKRHRGLLAWLRFERLQDQGNEEGARVAAKEAAKWYSRGIRARPRFRLLYLQGRRLHVIKRFQRSAILHANAYDAHRQAGNRLRARLHFKLATKTRWKRFNLGLEAFQVGHWDAAYANLDWAIVGWHDDTELVARLYRCIALRQRGEVQLADVEWPQLMADQRLRNFADEIVHMHHLPLGMPGT